MMSQDRTSYTAEENLEYAYNLCYWFDKKCFQAALTISHDKMCTQPLSPTALVN